MCKSANDWPVLVPLSDLAAMQTLPPKVEILDAHVKTLDRRVEGLHRTMYELMDQIAALRERASQGQQAPRR